MVETYTSGAEGRESMGWVKYPEAFNTERERSRASLQKVVVIVPTLFV